MANPWWVIYTAEQEKALHAPYIVEAAGKPTQYHGQTAVTVLGPYSSSQAANAAESNPSDTSAVAAAIKALDKNPIVNPLAGLAEIGDFFSKLGERATWIRVAEVVVGGGLVIVAISHLAANTSAGQTIVKAGKTAGKVAAVAA
jgi:hypothetical protein